MKNKTKIALLSVFSVAITILAVGVYLFLTRAPFEMQSPSLLILTGPDYQPSVYFFQEGFQDRFTSLCIPLGNNQFKRIARWEWNYPVWDSVWSKDGSVLALKLNNDYFLLHDFKSGQTIGGQYVTILPRDRTATAHLCDSGEVSSYIKTVIDSRGGAGSAVPCCREAFVRIKYSQWKRFDTTLKGGESGK